MKFATKLLLAAGIAAMPFASAFAANGCKNPNTDFDQVYCYTKLYTQADADLNTAYKSLVGKLDAAGRSALKTSELAWIKQRNAACTQTQNGDILVNLDCTVDQTTQRTNWINDRVRECTASACMIDKLK
jgi:uncharacterized protein YecT (DUF1311 family)